MSSHAMTGATDMPLPDLGRPLRVGIVAPVKEEARYLIEWIAYHRALGVSSFVLGDNGGDDHTSALLALLDAAGVARRLDWRGEVAFQDRFDLDAIPRLRGVADVCAVIDVDEFLRPLGAHDDIPTAVTEIFASPESSAAGLSWTTFGSNGRHDPGEGLVIERFTRRAADDHHRNRTVKSLIRPERIAGYVNPHVFTLTDGIYVNDRPEPLRWDGAPATAEVASWHRLRVDHFVVKSREEFAAKVRRGRAAVPKGRDDRDEAFFVSRDRNDVSDPMPAAFVERTKREIARLCDGLRTLVPADSPLRALLAG
jgi:hypothetical protein